MKNKQLCIVVTCLSDIYISFQSPDCLGIDWKRNAEDGETRCWFILPQSLAKTGRGTVEGALVVNNDVDHYRVTNCFSTPVSDNLVGADVTPPTKYTGTDEPPADRSK